MERVREDTRMGVRIASEPALTRGLTESAALILPALERFQEFGDEPDPTITERPFWWPRLDGAPLPVQGVGAREVMDRLREDVIPYGARIGGPGFSSNITTSPTTVPVLAQLAASVAGAQCEWNHAFNKVQEIALRWLVEMLGLSSHMYQGMFTDGGSSANLLCILAARQSAYKKKGIDPALKGVSAIAKPRLYASDQVTGVLHRQAGFAGIGRENLVTLPSDRDFRLDMRALAARVRDDIAVGCVPVAIIANAGTTNTGAIDPIREMADFCRDMGIWLHIDGAYGLPGILDPRVADLFVGLGEAESFVMDPHKWFATPVGTGAAFVRNLEILRETCALGPAPFLEEAHKGEGPGRFEGLTSPWDNWGIPYGDRGLNSSAPARGAAVWALLLEIGLEGMRKRVVRHNSFARELAECMGASPRLQVMAPVTLSTCCYRYIPTPWQGREQGVQGQLNELTLAVLDRMRARGRYIPSYTTIRGDVVLRSCFITPRMGERDVAGLVGEVEECGAAVWSEVSARA